MNVSKSAILTPSRPSPARGRGSCWKPTLTEGAAETVEIIVLWNSNPQMVVHRNIGGKGVLDFTIGEDPTCDFPIPSEHLAGETKLTLVELRSSSAHINLPPGADGEVVFSDGSVHGLATVACVDGINDGTRLPVISGANTVVELEPWTFVMRTTPAQDKFKAPSWTGWRPNLFTGISVLVHAIFFGIVALIPPDASGLIIDPDSAGNRFSKYMIVPTEAKTEVVPEMLQKKEEAVKDLGLRHKGTEGQMGDRRAKRTDNRFAIKGKPDVKQIRLARDMMKEMAQSSGILKFMSNQAAPTSPFGSHDPMGRDVENALGALVGNQPGANYGYGGLGVRGTGRGGGGDRGEGTIGVGNLEWINSSIRGDGIPYRPRALRQRSGDHKAVVPPVRTGPGKILGSIPKDVIRRLVRRQLSQIQFCYEKGLARRPDMAGRVSIKFLISPEGVVRSSVVVGSSLADAATEQCIAGVVRHIVFPKPQDNGVVIATYPFTLQHSGD